jgi:hypothetical protein
MKKVLVTSMALGFLSLAVSASADQNFTYPGNYPGSTYENGAGIVGTPHDLSTATGVGSVFGVGTVDPLDRICIYCHAPHNTRTVDTAATTYLPLWNRATQGAVSYTQYESDFGGGPDDESGVRVADYTAHGSASNHQLTAQTEPGGVSRLCLSCHDGSVATNQYYGTSTSHNTTSNPSDPDDNYITAATGVIGGNADMSNHHPVGFDYDEVYDADDEIASKDVWMNANYQIQDLLYAGKMECVTCHDVHNTKNDGDNFTWIQNNQSAFCCKCHLKCETIPTNPPTDLTDGSDAP